jgi:hypothetical protein
VTLWLWSELIGDIATGQVVDAVEDGKNAGATEMGRKGAAARPRNLSSEQRSEIARKGAATRWKRPGYTPVLDALLADHCALYTI